MTRDKQAHYSGYVLGVLMTAERLCAAHDQPGMAGEAIADLLLGESIATLRRICRYEGIRFPRRFWDAEVVKRGANPMTPPRARAEE